MRCDIYGKGKKSGMMKDKMKDTPKKGSGKSSKAKKMKKGM